MKYLQSLTIPPYDVLPVLLPALEKTLNGYGDPLTIVPTNHDGAQSLGIGQPIDDDIALVVTTAGTTGVPKGALLTKEALIAAGQGSHCRLGGPGGWILALPAHHIAGIGVIIRCLLAGITPIEIDLRHGFDPTCLPTAIAQLHSQRRYISLVSNQLAKSLTHEKACHALAELDAVLVGGGPIRTELLEAARDKNIPVVCSYGMSETTGGCVYDGVALEGMQIRINDDHRICLSGPTLARGYRHPIYPDPFRDPGWFITNDVGFCDHNGILHVLGRADEAILTGGLTVIPHLVEEAMATYPGIEEVAVFGLPDQRLGQCVAAAIVLSCDPPPTLAQLHAYLQHKLDPTAWPRRLYFLSELPHHSIGKVNRRALMAMFSSERNTCSSKR